MLVKNCTGCHIDAMQTRGGLRMDTFSQLLRGGDSSSVLQAGRGNESLLVQKLRGMVGNRMPAGGRPALSEDEIQLIATWIDEGATLDGASDRQPLRVMSQLAWASSASSRNLSLRRTAIVDQNLKLVSAKSAESDSVTTEHFRIVGITSKAALELIGRLAEQQMKTVRSVVPGPRDSDANSAEAFLPRARDHLCLAQTLRLQRVCQNGGTAGGAKGVDCPLEV